MRTIVCAIFLILCGLVTPSASQTILSPLSSLMAVQSKAVWVNEAGVKKVSYSPPLYFSNGIRHTQVKCYTRDFNRMPVPPAPAVLCGRIAYRLWKYPNFVLTDATGEIEVFWEYRIKEHKLVMCSGSWNDRLKRFEADYIVYLNEGLTAP